MNTAPSVCAQNFTAGYTLYNYVCDKKKYLIDFFFFYKTDYGKILKYWEKYWSISSHMMLF